MLIKSLKLRNIRSYTDASIEFPQGSILLSGDIGTGKSSILLALEFCLFGIKKQSYSASSLLRHGCSEGGVEACLSIEDKDVIISRSLKRTSNGIKQHNGYLLVDGVKTELSPVELKARVFELLGYPKEVLTKGEDLIYRFTVYTPQEEMKSILFEKPDVRLETLRKVFGIDKYKRIIENSSILTKKIREELKWLEGKSEGLTENAMRKKEYERKLDEIKKKVSDNFTELEKEKKECGAIQRELARLEIKREKRDKAIRIIEINKARIKEKQKSLNSIEEQTNNTKNKIRIAEEKLKALTPAEFDLEEIENSLVEIERKIQNTNAEKKRLNSTIEFCSKKKQESLNELDELKKEVLLIEQMSAEKDNLAEQIKEKKEISDKIESHQNQISELKSLEIQFKKQLSELQERISKISDLNACPLCLQEVGEEHKHKIKEEYTKKVHEIKRELESHRNFLILKTDEMEKLKAKLESLQEKEKVLIKIEEKIRNFARIARDINVVEKRIVNYDNEILKLKSEYRDLENINIEELKRKSEELRKKANTLREMRGLEKSLKDLKERKNTLQKSFEQINNDIQNLNLTTKKVQESLKEFEGLEDDLIKTKKAYEEKIDIIKNLEVDRARLETEASSLTREIEKIEKEIQEKQEFIKKKNRLSESHEWIQKEFIPLMSNIERHVMSKIYVEFSELFNHWFDILVGDDTITARLNDEFTPIIEQNGYETTPENLSGGEKTSLALAYRLSLNKVVNDIIGNIKTKDIIILDEPTDGFSSEQLDKVREVISQLNMKQVIMVSHEPKIESFVDNIIRVSKQEHVSRVYN